MTPCKNLRNNLRIWLNQRVEGSSVLEFALIMPVLMLVMVATVDFGQAYYVSIEVTSAAQAGTTYGLSSGTDTSGMQSAALLDAADVPAMTAVATYGCECSDGSSPILSCATLPICSVNAVNWVQVKTAVTYKPLFNYPGLPSSFALTGLSRMRIGR